MFDGKFDFKKVKTELDESLIEIPKIINDLPRTLPKALEYLRAWRNMNQADLATGADLDPRIIICLKESV